MAYTRASHKIQSCIWFTSPDDAAEAAKMYTTLFPPSPADPATPAIHQMPPPSSVVTNVRIADQEITILAAGPYHPLTPAHSLFVLCETQEEVDKLWDSLGPGERTESRTEKGEVVVFGGGKEIQCGWLTDRFGVTWQIVPRCLMEMQGDPDPEKRERVHQAMLASTKFDIEVLKKAFEGGS